MIDGNFAEIPIVVNVDRFPDIITLGVSLTITTIVVAGLFGFTINFLFRIMKGRV